MCGKDTFVGAGGSTRQLVGAEIGGVGSGGVGAGTLTGIGVSAGESGTDNIR
jgi:hypothetical protein